jgi:uncharacterized membrane-anchored protein
MRNLPSTGLLLGAFCLLGSPAFAQDAVEAEEESPVFSYQTGDIVLPNKVATLRLQDDYRYLDPAETEKLLVSWGNEPGNQTQGAIVPKGVEPMSEEGWAVILTYLDEGHVDDSEAAEIDYDKMLKDMKEGTQDENEARAKAGYPAVQLIGWAEKPYYDSATRKLYWAQELNFEGSPAHTLNYDVRVLGREGVLSMNAVASIHQLSQIRADMRPLIGVAEFNEGYRYADFNSSTDRVAEYGLAALIAGTVAAKLGFFAKIGAILLAFKKFVILGVVAIGGFFAKLLRKNKDSAA